MHHRTENWLLVTRIIGLQEKPIQKNSFHLTWKRHVLQKGLCKCCFTPWIFNFFLLLAPCSSISWWDAEGALQRFNPTLWNEPNLLCPSASYSAMESGSQSYSLILSAESVKSQSTVWTPLTLNSCCCHGLQLQVFKVLDSAWMWPNTL